MVLADSGMEEARLTFTLVRVRAEGVVNNIAPVVTTQDIVLNATSVTILNGGIRKQTISLQ